jgi:hypothetical protein
MQTSECLKEEFITTLISKTRSAEIETEQDIYGRLLGNWKLKMIDYYPDGRTQRDHTGTWYFSRTLEGRAIQDVLVSPEFADRSSGTSMVGNRYGNTFRMMDPKTCQWHIDWFNPVTGIHNQLTARADGDRIVQESAETGGLMMRWIFENITAESFHWYGESSSDKGKTWILNAEFFAERVKNEQNQFESRAEARL